MTESLLNLPGQGRMLDVVRRGLEASHEASLAVAFTCYSGLGLITESLRDIGARGGSVRLLTSTYQTITQPEALEAVRAMPFIDCRLHVYRADRRQGGAVRMAPVGFHTKYWSFKGTTDEAWIGSSDLTKGGLSTNVEWNLRTAEPRTLATTRRQFDVLWARPDVHRLTGQLVADYAEEYDAMVAARAPPVPSGLEPATPNEAQEQALERLAAMRASGARRAAVIAATGIGKTLLAAFDFAALKGRTCLYVSHRLEHLQQAHRSFARVLSRDCRLGIVGGEWSTTAADVVFATVQSLRTHPELLRRSYDYVVIDEFHHATASSYESVVRDVRTHFLLGLTATPERQDGHDVLEACDWNVAYEVRLPEAIDRGWLLPFHYFGIADETVDFANVPWRGGHSIDELERALSIEARAELVLRHALQRGFDGPKRATVGFCCSIAHARFMADAFNRRGQRAEAVWGESQVQEREAVYQRLSDPEDPLKWVFVADILNEGVDIPAINSILFLRPTESPGIFLQQMGRGLRLFPGTEVLTVLDFVGHHRASWLALKTLATQEGGGHRVSVQDLVIKPPSGCEIVLEKRTAEILAKVSRFNSRREECSDGFRRLVDELGRRPLPIDLWKRDDLPSLADFRAAFGSWSETLRANDRLADWERGLARDHPAFDLLRAAESDWQAQRVHAYALLWGLCVGEKTAAQGYQRFFSRWPQWAVEEAPLEETSAWQTLRKKLPEHTLAGDRIAAPIMEALGAQLLPEVEGRLLYTLNKDHSERHGGLLRTPEDLQLHVHYTRPEAIRHFGTNYDPSRHNKGLVWIGDHGIIICKLDQRGAQERHKYVNQLADPETFWWASQNQQTRTNELGLRVLEHERRGLGLRLFVQAKSHEPATYLGPVRVRAAKGDAPMQVTLRLDHPVPDDLVAEMQGKAEGRDG